MKRRDLLSKTPAALVLALLPRLSRSVAAQERSLTLEEQIGTIPWPSTPHTHPPLSEQAKAVMGVSGTDTWEVYSFRRSANGDWLELGQLVESGERERNVPDGPIGDDDLATLIHDGWSVRVMP